MKRSIIATLAAAALLIPTGAVAAQAQAAVSGVTLSVNCSATPERLTIHNGRSKAITITSVGSTYHPRSEEPFYVNKLLGAGKSITYTFGSGSGPNRLTHSYIFDNSASSESARVRTTLGTITRNCGN